MNTFKLTWEVVNSYPLIHLNGSLTLGSKQLLENTYEEILEQVSTKELIFDFTNIDYINSAGISSFLNIISFHNTAGVELIFVGLPDHIKRVLDIVGLTDYVKVFGTVDMAIQYCYNKSFEE